jgi:hypothetical protein
MLLTRIAVAGRRLLQVTSSGPTPSSVSSALAPVAFVAVGAPVGSDDDDDVDPKEYSDRERLR